MMKILCPTDFSGHSIKALEYAAKLSNDLDAEMHIISVFEAAKTASSFIRIEDKIRETYEKDIRDLLVGITPILTTDRLPTTRVVKGNTVDVILSYAHAQGIDMIVMGTQGSNSMRTLLFGGITRKVTEKSDIPVLAVPQNYKYHSLKNKLLLALDDKILAHESTFSIPLVLAEKYNTKIDIIHIEKNEEGIPFDPFVAEYLGDTIGEVILEKDKDPVSGIKRYVDDHPIMLLMMVRRNKGFFARLLTIGDTSEEIARTSIPLLILPDR